MPPGSARSSLPVCLVFGEDDHAVKQRAREVYAQWTQEVGGMDHEVIDANVSHSGEALKAVARLREALQTLPFFGSAKVVWFQNCNFLSEDRPASAQVGEQLVGLAQELKELPWDNLRLLISAGKVDRRKSFFKTLEKIGTVELFAAWSLDDKNWTEVAEASAMRGFKARGKEMTDEALSELVARVGPNSRQLENEVEKVCLYVGDRRRVTLEDVAAVCTRNKTARAFALGDALGDRNLPELLRRLDEELWEVKLDSQRSEIGLLYGLISKVRAMLLLKEMLREGWISPNCDYARFKSQLQRIPPESLPEDKRYNPLQINAYVLFKALPQVRRYSQAELVRAMDLLFQCNQRLVSSNLDEALVLQQTLVQIASQTSTPATAPRGTA